MHEEKSHSLFGLGVTKVGFPGMTPCSMARTALIRPEMPAAGSEWPMLLLICILLLSMHVVRTSCLFFFFFFFFFFFY